MVDLIEAEGKVHAINPIQGEYTLCGDAFDLASDEPGYEWKETSKKCVSCEQCAQIILSVRDLKVRVSK